MDVQSLSLIVYYEQCAKVNWSDTTELCGVCHFFHESLAFEILNFKYNLFVVDGLPANRSVMQLLVYEDILFRMKNPVDPSK